MKNLTYISFVIAITFAIYPSNQDKEYGQAIRNANVQCELAVLVPQKMCDPNLTDGFRCHVLFPNETVLKEAFVPGSYCIMPFYRPFY